ncbi:MAG: GNAT family N-acetyltransferase [bacterium]|nr:GNAT family N-acetyltransferase [bacterium]
MLKIRKMKSDDYDNVYNLWLSCAGMGLNNIDDTKDGIDRFLKRNPDTCFIAEYENKVVGVIMVGNDGRRGYIYHTSVKSEYRNQGIGSKLVDTAINALKNQGINKVALVVFTKNESGNAFWEKQGFTQRNDLIYRNKALTDMTRIDT